MYNFNIEESNSLKDLFSIQSSFSSYPILIAKLIKNNKVKSRENLLKN